MGLIVGSNIASLAGQLADYGIADVVTVEDDRLTQFASGATATAIASVAKSEGADTVLLSHTSYGKDLGPRVAVKLEAGYAPDGIAFNGDTITRSVYAGKGRVNVRITTPTKVVSIRPNVFTASTADAPATVAARSAQVEFNDKDFAARVVETRVNTERKM